MKRSISKKSIKQIMSDYNCSEEEAIKAYLDAGDKANETFEAELANRFGIRKSLSSDLAPKVCTPREIKDYLDKLVIGQEVYKNL